MDTNQNESKIISGENMARFIDHTLLKPDATGSEIRKLCEEAVNFRFAAVCINPVFVTLAAEILKGTDVKVCTVAGFPLGAGASESKASEAGFAVRQGAQEVDMVMWVGALKEENYNLVEKDIAGVVEAVRAANSQALVKVIIETCLLTDSEKIKACKIAESAGAAFVKTSTGFSTGGAVVSDVALMRGSVGPTVGVKASGGIRTADQAVDFIKAGAARIGTSSGIRIFEELSR